MTIYNRPDNSVFASGAKQEETGTFPDIERGWGVTESTNFIPPLEYFNAVQNRTDKAIAYLMQRGVAEWSKDIEYPQQAITIKNGQVFFAKQQNTNKDPLSNPEIWVNPFAQKANVSDVYTKDDINKLFHSKVINSIEDLRKTEPASLDARVYLTSYYEGGDAGGGFFYFDELDKESADNAGTVVVTADGARWKRISEPLNVEMFGAIGDGVSDDTSAFESYAKAISSKDSVNLSHNKIYAVKLSRWKHSIKGNGSILTNINTSSEYIINLTAGAPHWDFLKISNVNFKGKSLKTDLVWVGDITPFAGRWLFEQCSFSNANKCIFKKTGNIGCGYENSHFYSANFGVYAISSDTPLMHAGADTYKKCHFDKINKACSYYYNQVAGFGQITYKDVIMEGNKGFGVFIRNSLRLAGTDAVLFNTINLENTWCEANTKTIIDNFEDIGRVTTTDYRFDNLCGVTIAGSFIQKLEANNSNICLSSCRFDLSYPAASYNDLKINNSVVTAKDSISDVSGYCPILTKSLLNIPRGTINGGMTFVTPFMTNKINIFQARLLNNNSLNNSSAISLPGTTTIKSTPISGGIAGDYYHRLEIVKNGQHLGLNRITVPKSKFYVITLNARIEKGDVSLTIGGATGSYGKLILQNEWQSFCIVGKEQGQKDARIYIVGKAESSILDLCDYQVLYFDTEQDAVNYVSNQYFSQI